MTDPMRRMYLDHIRAAVEREASNWRTIRGCLRAIRADRRMRAQLQDELTEAQPQAAE